MLQKRLSAYKQLIRMRVPFSVVSNLAKIVTVSMVDLTNTTATVKGRSGSKIEAVAQRLKRVVPARASPRQTYVSGSSSGSWP